MVVWPDGLIDPVTIAVRSHIVELNNKNMKNEGKQNFQIRELQYKEMSSILADQ
jgi:hypothetical protein